MVSINSIYGIMLQCVFLTVVFADPGNAQVKSLDKVRITLDKSDWSLSEMLAKIENDTDYNFIYPDDVLANQGPIQVEDRKKNSVQQVLEVVSKETGLKFRQVNKAIYVAKTEQILTNQPIQTAEPAQQRRISGQVISEDEKESLPGVNVILKGTSQGTVTDVDGRYSIEVPGPDAVLVFSAIGHLKEEVTVGNRTEINISLVPDITSLEEVVVVGFGTQRKEVTTGSFASIDTKELLQAPVANVSNALAGRMAGVLAVQQSGEPGEDISNIRIRGVGTFSGNQQPLIMVDGIEQLNWNNIDPNEIESVTVLKDASATAVYGVRGANGVILITTKRGQVGAPKISYSSNFAVNRFTDLRPMMNSYDYARTFNEAQRNDAVATGGAFNPRFSDEDLIRYRDQTDPILFPNTNWFDEIYQDFSMQQQHNFNINGGTERVKYFVSTGFFDQEGLFKAPPTDLGFEPNQRFRRYNFRSNTDFAITDRLSAALNIDAQLENRSGLIGLQGDIRRGIDQIQRANPISSPGFVDGRLIQNRETPGVNPYEQVYGNGYFRDNREYLNGSLRMDYDMDYITPGLKVHGTISYQNFNQHRSNFRRNIVRYEAVERTVEGEPFVAIVPMSQQSAFGFDEFVARNRRTYAEMGINYDRRFGNHTITGLLLYNQLKFFDPAFEFGIPNGYQSMVGRTTYDYAGKYLVSLDLGYNGTENFAEGQRFGFFPAVSAGYILSEENFFPKGDAISFLKFKASYGEVGNDRITDITETGSRFLYNPSAYVFLPENAANRDQADLYFLGELGVDRTQMELSREGIIGNPLLTWERARKTNIGIEMALAKDRIFVEVDYFNEDRDNILANLQTAPNITGARLPAFNIGQMNNEGVDGQITYQSKMEGKDFHWFLRGNFTYATNTVVFQDEVEPLFAYQMRTGQRLNQNFGLIAEGLYNTWEEVADGSRPASSYQGTLQPGDIRYRDVNGDGVIDFNDVVPIGYSNFPEIMYGISFGFTYKNFDVTILFQGADNISYSFRDSQIRGYTNNYGAPEYLLESWSQERFAQGETINFPRLGIDANQHNLQSSTYWTRDARYVRLKNAEIGYTLGGSTLQRLGVRSTRFYVNGNNVWTWSNMLPGVDPESIAGQTNIAPYPLVMTLNAGVNIQF